MASRSYPVDVFLKWAAKRGDNRMAALRRGCTELSGSAKTINESSARSWADVYDVDVTDIWPDAIAPAGDEPTECDFPDCHKPVKGLGGLAIHKQKAHGIAGSFRVVPVSYGRASKKKVFGVDGVCSLLESERDKLRAQLAALDSQRESLTAEIAKIEKAYKVLRESVA